MAVAARAPDCTKQWTTFIHKCQRERLATERFEAFAKLLDKKAHVSGQVISRAILATQQGRASIDPLLVSYIRSLLRQRIVLGHELLTALLPCSYSKSKAVAADASSNGAGNEAPMQRHVSAELESLILNAVALLCASHELPGSSSETAKTLAALSDWMGCLVDLDHQAMIREVSEAFRAPDPETAAVHEALGRLVVVFVEAPRVVGDIEAGVSEEVVKRFAKSLAGFASLLSTVSMPLSNRLQIFQQSHDVLRQMDPSGFGNQQPGDGVHVGEIQIGNIVDRPVTHTRAYLAVYFDSLLCGLPHVNDNAILSHLQSRFKGDNESLVASSISGAFDLLAVASARGDSADRMFVILAFLTNKVPLLMNGALNLNYHSFMPLNLPVLISQAFVRLDTNGLNQLHSGLGMETNGDTMAGARRDFLLACGLNGLISEEDIKHIANDTNIKTLAPSTRANRTNLTEECRSNPQKIDQVLKSLEAAKGDAGEYVAAVVEIIRNLCSSQDTMTLKTICLSLCPKPHAIDMIFLFSSPSSILGPICQVLEEWKYDDDQGEYQPVYEEFSACLLFILVCIHRYDLNASHLELQPDSKFVSWLLDLTLVTRPIQKPSEEQVKQLGGWAKGLFELEVISDDVMSICPPQDFYKLVPTVFAQTFMARRLDVLAIKALESGTELLLEPFLLPSMILGVQYLAEQAWKQPDSSKAFMPFLAKLIRPSAKSGETLGLQNIIVSILKPKLKAILHSIRSADSIKQEDMDPLLEHLNQTEALSRRAEVVSKPFSSAISGPGSTVLSNYRAVFDSLCSWSMPAGLVASVPTYSNQELLAVLRLYGAAKVLSTTVDALVAYTETGFVDIALDIATAIVCAEPSSNNMSNVSAHPAEVTLRHALQLAREDAARIVTKEPVRAELIVLLHRRVETQLSAMPLATMQQMDLQNVSMQNVDMGLNMDMGAHANVNMDMNLNMNMDMMNMDVLNVDQGNPQMPVSTQDISAIDFGAAENQAMSLPESQFPLALDTSFGVQSGVGTNDGEEDDEARRTSVEDIWSGLGLDTDGMDFT